MTPTVRQGGAERRAYSIARAADTLDVSKATIWRKVAEGELETFKLGSRTLIPAESLDALVARCRNSPPTPASARAA
jgi:excisionase family DNA binding protein